MPLVPLSGFITAMEKLVGTPVRPGASAVLRASTFISTEDPFVVRDALAQNGYLREHGWSVYALPIRRLPQTSFELGGPDLNVAVFGAYAEVMQSMWNLAYALECDAWVGTIGSNWNRLIHELRGVWLRKADQVCRVRVCAARRSRYYVCATTCIGLQNNSCYGGKVNICIKKVCLLCACITSAPQCRHTWRWGSGLRSPNLYTHPRDERQGVASWG